VSNNKYQQILKVLESNDTRCTDDRADREALASVLVQELFPDVFGTTELDNVR
jgi:hypothetical protein